ncbi:MAG: hypothetical protein MMC33_005648 [Icmadophila ericetorum]|nr:hypothetical protein [Icmadophila ericetorum]
MPSLKSILSVASAFTALACGAVIPRAEQYGVECPAPAASSTPELLPNGKAIYFMTNARPNQIVALPINNDGTLSEGTLTPTGGDGSVEVDATTGKPTVPDALASQGAVRVVGQHLFVVNAGSNTISMFEINKADPTKLTLLGRPVSSGGEFPVTIGVSQKHKIACVANTGAKDGIACAAFSALGLGAMDSLRPFNLKQKTPPTGPENTVSDSFFNLDETALITTVKGNPAVNNVGFMSVFPVVNGDLSTQDIKSSPPGTAVLFGFTPIPGTENLFVTDASFGAAIMTIDQVSTAALDIKTPIADQKATCWTTISPFTNTGFVTDVANNHLVEMDLATGAIIKELKLNNGNPGMIDLEAAGAFIYALSPGNATVKAAVTVFDVSAGPGKAQQIQNFNPKGVTDTAQGMVALA